MTEIPAELTDKRRFHLGDMVSITSGLPVSPNRIGGVYQIIDYITGVAHFTHQLPRGADACKPWLIKQHPWLAEVTPPESFTDEASVTTWLAEAVVQHGEFHDVEPMPFGAYIGSDPVSELAERVGGDVITVEISATSPNGGRNG